MIETPAEILAHHAGRDAAASFAGWRKTIKKPLTERAALMIAKTLAAINAAGGNATEALDLAQEHGWQTIKADWYWNLINGKRNHDARRVAAADTADRQIAFAARSGRTPGEDCF
jgi:hypothetical protein